MKILIFFPQISLAFQSLLYLKVGFCSIHDLYDGPE